MADLQSLQDGDLENYVKVTKIKSTLLTLPTMYLCMFGQNPSTGSKCSRQNPYFKVPVWPWKLGQGHQKLINSSTSTGWGDIIHQSGKQIWLSQAQHFVRKASEYDQEIQQSHTADQPTTPLVRATEQWQSQDIRKTVKTKQPALFPPSRWLQN